MLTAEVAAVKRRHLPGEEGTWVFIFGDMMIFAVVFLTYLTSRGKDPGTFDRGQSALSPGMGTAMTLLLLLSSLLVANAVRAARAGDRRLAPRLLTGAALCGLGFVALKVVEYHERIAHHDTPSANEFFLYYFILTGLHLFHLVLGLLVLGALVRLSARAEISTGQFSFIEGGSCFWHMIDLLWIVLFPLLYFVRA